VKTLHWASAGLLAAAANLLVCSPGMRTVSAADPAPSSWPATKIRAEGPTTPSASLATGDGHGATVIVPVVYGAEAEEAPSASSVGDSLEQGHAQSVIGEAGGISLKQPSVATNAPAVNLISAQPVVTQPAVTPQMAPRRALLDELFGDGLLPGGNGDPSSSGSTQVAEPAWKVGKIAAATGSRKHHEQPSVTATGGIPTAAFAPQSDPLGDNQLPISEASWVSDDGGAGQPGVPIVPAYGSPVMGGYPQPPMMPGMTPYAGPYQGPPGTFVDAQHLQVGYAQQPLEPVPATPGDWMGTDDMSGSCGADGAYCDPGMFPCGALWGSGERVYVRMQYLNWQMDGVDAPAFVTTSPDGTVQNESGVLGFPDTTILFGNQSFHGEGRSGGRLTAGYWLSSDDVFGIEFDAWGLEDSTASYFANSDGSPILARPYFNTFPEVGDPGQDSSIIARPNTIKDFPFFGDQEVDLAGNIGIDLRSRVWSGGAAIRDILTLGGPQANWRVDYMLGYRYFDLSETATFNEVIVPTGGGFAAGANFVGRERFSADNYFNGGELGLASRYQFGCFTAEAVGRVALGNMHQKASISGRTTFNDGLGETATVSGDFYAQPTNIGQYRQDKFTVIPELTLNLHYHITPQVRILAGYSAVYVSNVVRAIDQIDTNLNQQRFWMETGPGPPDPQFVFRTSEVLLHGVNGGIEIRY